MHKAKITYRINNKDNRTDNPGQTEEPKVIQLHEEEFRVEKAAREMNPFTNDYGAWDSPYDAETRRLERLIREADERKREQGKRAPERGPESRYERGEHAFRPEDHRAEKQEIVRGMKGELAEWPEEEEDYAPRDGGSERERRAGYGRNRQADRNESGNRYRDTRYDPVSGYYGADGDSERHGSGYSGVSVTGSRYIRHSRTPWLKITASVTGAVVTGVALGFFVLSMFSDDKAAETDKMPELNGKQETAVSAPGKNAAAGGTADPGKQPAAGGTSGIEAAAAAVAIPAKSYVVLQGGSFGTPQSAETEQANFRKKGLAAVTETSDRSYVYIGIAANKESAQELSSRLKAANIDIYVKEYALPEVKSAKWSGSKEALQNYLAQSDKLVQMASKLTLMHLEEQSLTPLDDATLQSVKAAHEAWAQSASAAAEGAQEEVKQQINKLNNAMNSMKKSIDEYKKNPSSSMLWQAQTYMLQFVIAEKELLQSIAV